MFKKNQKETSKVMEYLKKEEKIIRRRRILNRLLIFFFFIGSLGGIYALTLENNINNDVKSEDVEFISEESFVLKYVEAYFSSDPSSIEFVEKYSSSLVKKPSNTENVAISDIGVGKVENNYEDNYYTYFGYFNLNENYFSYKLNLSINEYLVLNNIEFEEYEYETPTTDDRNKINDIFSEYVDLTKEEYDEYDELTKLFFKNYSSDYNSVKVMYDKVEPLHENIVYDLETLKIMNSGKNSEKEIVLLNVSIDTNVVIDEVVITKINYNYLIKIDKSNNKILLMEQII